MSATLAPVFGEPAALDALLPYLAPAERAELDTLLAGSDAIPSVPHVVYQRRPIDWIVDVLGLPRHRLVWSRNPGFAAHAWDGTPDPIVAITEALRDWRNVGVESGTTTGKTHLGACLVLWFLACWEDALVVTVAPKEEQLALHIWKEIGALWPRFQRHFPSAERSHLRIRMRPGLDRWAAVGFVAGVSAAEADGSAVKAQGFHAEHMLIVFEEMPGIRAAITTAFKNTCMAPHNLRIGFGNPDHQHDELHRFCTAPGVVPVRISALDHPNVVADDPTIVPGAASRVRIEERAAEYGPDSPMYQSRVRGISPPQSTEAVIQLAWLEAAAQRYDDLETRTAARRGRPAYGVDVAQSEHGDQAAVARGHGACLEAVTAGACPNATHLGRDVAADARVEGVRPEHIGVDPVGVGAATLNELRELVGPEVQALWGSGKPIAGDQKGEDGLDREWLPDANVFYNLRAQMWWTLREDLRLGRLAVRRDGALFRELTSVQWKRQLGKVLIEDKHEVRRRIGHSPNLADAAVYWNFARGRSAAPPPRPARVTRPGRDPLVQHAEQTAPMRDGWNDDPEFDQFGPGF